MRHLASPARRKPDVPLSAAASAQRSSGDALIDRQRRLAADKAARSAARAERQRAREREEAAAAIREAEAVVREREQALMAAEEDRQRALERAVAAIAAQHGDTVERTAEVLFETCRIVVFRAAHSPAVLAALRSPALKRSLKSDVKKSTALVKRVTTATEETAPAIIKEIESLNLSRYAGEVREGLLCVHRSA